MTISSETNRTSAVGTGAEQIVPFTFPITDNSDIVVTQRVTATGVETTLTETTHYTVTNNGESGGSITTVNPFVAATAQIHIVRNTPNTQALDLEQGGAFNAENIEDALDKNTKLTIESKNGLERTLKFPTTDPSTSFSEMPNSVDRASKTLTFDSLGKPTASVTVPEGSVTHSVFGTSIAEAADAEAGRILLEMGTTDSVQFDDVITKSPLVDARAFGAAGDGVTVDTTDVQSAITESISVGKPALFPVTSASAFYETGALNTTGAMLRSRNTFYNDARGLAEPLDNIDVDPAQALTHTDGDFVFSYRNSNLTGNDIYDNIFPTIDALGHYDVLNGVCDIVDGGTIEHAAAVSGYVKNLDATVNGVCLFGTGYVDVDNGSIWGINTLLQDDAIIGAGVEAGRTLANEFDFNVQHTGTEVIGLSVGGNSTEQPGTATAFIANTLGTVAGTGLKWGTGFATLAGTCDNALGVAAIGASAANINSQKIIFGIFDNTSTAKTGILQAQTSGGVEYLVLDGATDKFNFKVTGANIYLEDTFGLIVDGTTVVTNQQTELTPELTQITHTSPAVADYIVQDLVQNTGFGFATKDEGNTVLSVILNLQTRVDELETKLQAHGLIA